VSALGTVYALSATADDTAQALMPLIARFLEPGHGLVAAGLVVSSHPQCLTYRIALAFGLG
jgi:hypothetical protein